jgi:hypothetical protein
VAPITGLPPEVELSAKAIGLLDADGNLDADWFSTAASRLQSILSNPAQRAAFLALLDSILPHENLAGLKAGEKWHPLLGSNPRGNLYLIVRASGSQIDFGFGGLLQSTAGAPAAALKLRLPVIQIQDASIQPIAGTTSGPLDVELRVVLNWQRNVEAIGLRAIRITGSLSPIGSGASANLTIVLEQLDLDGSGPRDTTLDPSQLDAQALDLILGLVQEKLRQIAGGAAGEAARVAANLGPLLGLEGNIPRFPFDRIAEGPSALQAWLSQLVDTGRIVDWLSSLGRLMGAGVGASGSGTAADPWRVRIIALAGGASGVEVTFVRKPGPLLDVGLKTVLIPSGASPAVQVEARAALASIPLSGTAQAVPLPSAEIVVSAPGDASTLVNSAAITVQRLRTGLSWNGTTLIALLELVNVTFAGAQYDRIDLTNTDSVAAAASAAVEAALRNALGNAGAGARLAALVGLIRPAGDATWPHTLNPATLVTNPTAAIAGVHRAALLDAAHNWSFLLEELAALVGLASPVTGSGTRGDPWRVTLAPGPLAIELAAWNEQTSGIAADPQMLRVGVRASASRGPMGFWWLAEILAFDLPASGGGDVRLMAGQHASFLLQPVPAVPERNGISMTADSVGITMDWAPGGSMSLRGIVTNVNVTAGGVATNVPQISFPPPAGVDVTDPIALGVPVASLETLFRALLAHGLVSWTGRAGAVLSSLLGLHRTLDALPEDWPVLRDPAGPGSLFSDPPAAIRDWLDRVTTGVSADGLPFMPRALATLRVLLANGIPALNLPFRGDELPIEGSGTYEEPWSLGLTRDDSKPVELLAWLEPGGPPAAWANSLSALVSSASDLVSLVNRARMVADFVPGVRSAFAAVSSDQIIGSLTQLNSYFSDSDGIVPISSQIPTGGTWTGGTTFQSAHHVQPSHPSAISQILAQVEAWQPGAPRAVLLLGPSFGSRDSWSALLVTAEAAAAGSTSPAAHFNLRLPGVDPLTIDLSSTTASADFYTADLQDDGIGDVPNLSAQISRLAARIGEIRAGAPLIIVAHSTSGVAARAFTAANPSRVRGLITLGAPHLGASLIAVRNPDAAAAVRWIRGTGVSFPPGPLKDAIDHIVQAVDGFRLPPSAGELPPPFPYPVGSFAGMPGTDTAGVPALALGSTIGTSLLDGLKQSLGTMATEAAAAATTAPTHVAFGVRASLGLPPTGTDLAAVATIRADAFRIGLRPGVAEPARPAHGLAVNVVLERQGGWLVGTPQAHLAIGAQPADVRLRRAELGATIGRGVAGLLSVTPRIKLYDGAFHGPLETLIELGQPLAGPVLGALFQRLSNPEPLAGSGLDLLLDSFQALGIAVPDPAGGIGLSAEGLTAITVDGAGFLGPKLRFAFELPGGVGAFEGPPEGPWVLPIVGLPLEAYVTPSSIGIRSKAGTSLSITGGSLALDARLDLPGFNSQLTITSNIGRAAISFSGTPGTLTLAIPPWLESLTLIPTPPPAAFVSAFNLAVPRLLLSSAITAVFESIVGPEFDIGPIDLFLSSPSSTTSGSGALGSAGFLDATRINQLLEEIGRAIGAPAGPGLTVPGNLRLTASGTDPITMRLETTAAIGGVVSFQLDANIDRLFHVTPAGQLSVQTPLTGVWPSVEVAFGTSPAGVTLIVRPQGVPPIQILPTFSGFGSLALAGAALLPSALDALVASFGAVRPPLVDLVLDVAEALDLWDTAGGFAAHDAQLRTMLTGGWFAGFSPVQQSQIADAIEQLFTNVASPLQGQLPGEFSTSANTVVWSFPTTAAATLKVILGWDGAGPTLIVRSTGFRSGDAPFEIDFGGGYAGGAVVAEAAIAARLQSSIGVGVKPQLRGAFSGGSFQVRFLPLGASSDGALRIDIAPSPGVQIGATGVRELAEKWLLPIVSSSLLSIPGLDLNRRLWTGGKTIHELLVGAEVIDAGGVLRSPLPSVDRLIGRLLLTLASGTPAIPVTPSLNLNLVGGSSLGARVSGRIEIPVGSLTASVFFGDPVSMGPDGGVTVSLFSSTGETLLFDPKLHVVGFGFGLAGRDGEPLVNTAVFRLGGFGALLFFDVSFLNASRNPQLSFERFGAGGLLEQFGIPLGQALSQNMGGNNPVAASLLQSDPGTPGGSGETQPVNPEVDVSIVYRNNHFSVTFGGVQAIWIPVQRTFGPIYIDQLGVALQSEESVSLLVDGSVKIASLTVQADDLGVTIPFRSLLSPLEWTLELRGLAVSYQEGAVSIAGGLLKDPGPPVQYVGMLLVSVAGRGFTAVGAYARPSASGDTYTSFFVFASIGFPLGGPPWFFVLGLGGGMGYNRRLLVPEDVGQIGNFLLVAAIDNSNFANDPMGALRAMLVSVPPSRGSLWLAAGLKFTSFALIEGVAVIYVALDRGFEIGLLGIGRMALPRPEFPIAMVELTLKARFSTAEMVLSVQAQLTDNSFIFHRSCRLTGGFAFFIWFRTGEFVLTLGGYHPAFAKPAHFPIVPRLGFHWSVADNITIKGEAYFALTTTCVMAGGRLEASARFGPIRAWFTAYADLLVSWDPFFYKADIGISVGVEARIRICFIVCGTVHIRVSVGAHLHIEGPPLHGTVTVEYWVIKVTVPFGDPPQGRLQITWEAFKQKYLIQGDPEKTAIGIQLASGLVPPEPPGATPAPGTLSQPWKIGAEFSFTTETRMPATSLVDPAGAVVELGFDMVDVAPVRVADVRSTHQFGIVRLSDNTGVVLDPSHWIVKHTTAPFPEATWRMFDLENVPAAARNIEAISGLTIEGVAVLVGQTALIRIKGVVDDDPSHSLPLPFSTVDPLLIDRLRDFGVAAQNLVTPLLSRPAAKLLDGAEAVLSGEQFAQSRSESNLPARGLSPVAKAALRNLRSSPPLIEPLSTGLTMKPVSLAEPPPIVRVPPEPPVLLGSVRLRAVFETKPQAVASTPPSVRTSVSPNAARNTPRMAPPQAKVVPGARLHLVSAKGAPRPTTASVGSRTLRNFDGGFWLGERQRAAFDQAAADVIRDGVKLPSGVTHIWDLPEARRRTLSLTGRAGGRVVFISASGVPLADVELPIDGDHRMEAPSDAVRVAVTCFGEVPAGLQIRAPRFGVVSAQAAPAGAWAATGWQSGNQVQQISSTLFLARGATMITSRSQETAIANQSTSYGLTVAANAIADEAIIETRLPAATNVVAVLLDRQDATAADRGDLSLAADGATLATPPVALGVGSRRILLYDVASRENEIETISISVASRAGWRIAGVAGLAGRAIEWAARFNGSVPENLVPDGPLTPTGTLTVRFTIEEQ